MIRFQVLLFLWRVTSCSCIDKIPEVAKTKVSKPEIFYIKVKTLPCPPKTAHLNTPPHVSQCGKICITPPTDFYSGCSNVAAMSWRHCVSFVKASKRHN